MVRLSAALACTAIACQSSGSGGLSGASASIGPEGGILVASDGTRVVVPAGALPATATLTLQPAAATPPAGASFVSASWSLLPGWLQFAQPITVTFPFDPALLDAGPVVLTTAQGVSGYLALAATPVDATHVSARSSQFATGGVASATCAASCTAGGDAVGVTLGCSSTCVGHAYVLSCSGPAGAAASCTCAIDGAVSAIVQVDAGDGDAAASAYATTCGFPASSWSP